MPKFKLQGPDCMPEAGSFQGMPEDPPSLATGPTPLRLEKVLRKLDAPLVQVFAQPWNKPMIVLSDFRKARDIMSRRELGRATSAADLPASLVSDHHVHMKTLRRWRARRRLIQDLLAPSTTWPAPPYMRVHFSWSISGESRVRSPGGRPWVRTEDIDHAAVDSVLVSTFFNAKMPPDYSSMN